MTELWAFLGRFHPLLVHFPIALLVLAGVLEVFASRRVRADEEPSAASRFVRLLWIIGAATAAGAAATGYLLGSSGGYGGAAFTRHQQLGFAVAIGATLTALLAVARMLHGGAVWRRVHAGVAGLTLAALVGAGHLGATLTHGEGYLFEHAPGPIKRVLTRIGLGAPERPPAPPLDQARVYASLVEPVLQARCVSCHGPGRAEGKLRLDSPDGLRKGGSDGPILAPGRADRSEIVRRMWLPATDEDVMPPAGEAPLRPADAALVRWWIDRGASFDAKVVDTEPTPDVTAAIEAVFGPIERGGPTLPRVKLPPPDAAALARLSALRVAAVPVAADTPFLHVHATNARTAFGDAELAALEPLAAHVLWLDVSRTRITDAGLATIAKLTNLTRLDLNHTAVTDAGLARLAPLTRLESLNLYGTSITDVGLDQLKALTSLRALHLWQTGVSPEGVARLKSALPAAGITLDSAAPVPATPSSATAPAPTVR